jgi:hypothetical protein
MMEKAMDEPPNEAQWDPRFRTRSPEQAIHLCESAYYLHRLSLLGPSHSFGFTQLVTQASCPFNRCDSERGLARLRRVMRAVLARRGWSPPRPRLRRPRRPPV